MEVAKFRGLRFGLMGTTLAVSHPLWLIGVGFWNSQSLGFGQGFDWLDIKLAGTQGSESRFCLVLPAMVYAIEVSSCIVAFVCYMRVDIL